ADYFSINNRRAELFSIKQNKNEDPIEFLNQIKELVENSDWYGISENEAICLFFERGVRCSKSKNICLKFMEKHPEGNFQKLTDQLIGALTSEEPRSRENCTNCGKKGHLEINCWGNCPACGGQDHSPGSCQLTPKELKIKDKKRRQRKKWAENKKLKLKMQKIQTQQNLPDEESSGQYWADSLSDGETVIDTNHEEESLEEISEEEDTSEEVKRVKEVIGDASEQDIISIIEKEQEKWIILQLG
ncbi:MAG: hypothetical protein VX721_03735, partial [Thermoproteota archaeon]|nr:hypothetical protein [Thermoproteota archaeon]